MYLFLKFIHTGGQISLNKSFKNTEITLTNTVTVHDTRVLVTNSFIHYMQ